MGEVLTEMFTPGSILQLGLLAGLMASVSYGIVGTLVVARRISYIAAAIAHSVLGGIGFAVFCQEHFGWAWFSPFLGAVLAAVSSALLIGCVSLFLKEREDTIISAVWAVGMSLGVIFLHMSPGFEGGLERFLFGSIIYIEPADLWLQVGLGFGVVVLSLLFYHKLVAVCFDEEFARLRGVNVPLYFLLLIVLSALCVVLLVQLAGIVMSIALIVLPAATGLQFARKLWHAMAIAVGLSMLLTTFGLGISYANDFPSGATIVLLAGIIYFSVLAAGPIRRRLRQKL